MGADKRVSTTNYLWPSKLSYHCSLKRRKPGLLCYCWKWEKEGGSWNQCASMRVQGGVTYGQPRLFLCLFSCPFCSLAPSGGSQVSAGRGKPSARALPESERNTGLKPRAGKHLGAGEEQTNPEEERGRRRGLKRGVQQRERGEEQKAFKAVRSPGRRPGAEERSGLSVTLRRLCKNVVVNSLFFLAIR